MEFGTFSLCHSLTHSYHTREKECRTSTLCHSLTHSYHTRKKKCRTSTLEHQQTQVRHVLEFLRALRTIEKCRVVWYDSVTTSGRVAYQNALTLENKDFFDAAGEIFTNYRWRDARVPMLCAQRAGKDRACGVYMGVDVFGRGTFSGGGYNTTQAIETSLRAGVSSAVFAPGWVYESSASHFENAGETFTNRSDRFWSSIRKVCVSECMRDSRISSIPLVLTFDQGHGKHFRVRGQDVKERGSWHDLSFQSLKMYDVFSVTHFVRRNINNTIRTQVRGNGSI